MTTGNQASSSGSQSYAIVGLLTAPVPVDDLAAFSAEQAKGKLLIDCGASRCVVGLAAFADYYEAFAENFGADTAELYFKKQPDEKPIKMTFADGREDESLAAMQMPVVVSPDSSGNPNLISLVVHVLDAPGPMLMGMNALSALGISMYFQSGVAWVKATHTKLRFPQLTSGHFYIDLYEGIRRML